MEYIWYYIFVLIFTIIVDYFAGIFIENSQGKKRKLYLLLSIVANILILSVFKYFNFINDNISFFLGLFDMKNPVQNIGWALPVGLSFHTFQAMSYTIEVYRGNFKAERNFGIYALYVMFFPQLVAGPIERPQNMIHQFYEEKQFEYDRVVAGLRIILWGFFKKLVIADRMGIYVNAVYNNPYNHGGITLTVASLFFILQSYCDFSGYSDIAIGSGRVMGYQLMENFRRPILARNFTDRVIRWHISLYTWFRDYVFLPFTTSGKRSKWKLFAGIMLIFTLSGFWHGPSFTYIFAGAYTGLIIILERFYLKTVKPKKWVPKIPLIILGTSISLAFYIPMVIFYRSLNLKDAGQIFSVVFNPTKFGHLFKGEPPITFLYCVIVGILLIVVEIIQEYIPKMKGLNSKYVVLRYSTYLAIMVLILMIGVFNGSQFLYFQF
jgi:D-alanyl-lipoteichoic acid acyltransferase DltB (MBOAT superfamily)